MFFFRVVDARPSRRKRLRTDLMKSLSSSHVAVSLHDVLHCNAAERLVTVALRATGSGDSASRVFDGTADIQSCLVWDVDEEVVWLLKGRENEAWLNEGSIPRVLGLLVQAQAWHGVGSMPVSADQDDILLVLDQLEDAGLVQQLDPDGEQLRWQLSEDASSTLRCGVRLCRARDALQVRPDQPVISMTTWELLQTLHKDGFQELPFRTGVDAFNVSRNGPKKFYTIGGKWCRAYLQVLVSRRELQAAGIKIVQHGCKASVHKAMLESTGVVQKRRVSKKTLRFADDEGLTPDGVLRPVPGPSGARGGHFGARQAGAAADEAAQDGDGEGGDGLPPVPLEAAGRRAGRRRHDKTHCWPHDEGPCRLIFKPPSSWQATCPRKHSHHNPDKPITKCTRTMSFAPDGRGLSEQDTLRLLRFWLFEASKYATRTEHMGFKPSLSDLPSDEDAFLLEAMARFACDYNSDPDTAPQAAESGAASASNPGPSSARRLRSSLAAAKVSPKSKAEAVPKRSSAPVADVAAAGAGRLVCSHSSTLAMPPKPKAPTCIWKQLAFVLRTSQSRAHHGTASGRCC